MPKCQISKNIHATSEKKFLKTIIHQKESFLWQNPAEAWNLIFSTMLKIFCQWYVLVPHFTKKSVEILKQLADCLFFSWKIFLLEKII